MPLVTERPRAPISRRKDPNSGVLSINATRVLDVSGVASEAEAYAALAGYGVDDGAEHPQYPEASCTSIDGVEVVRGGMYTYTATYSSQGENGAQMLEPPVIRYDPYEYTEPSDRDANGVPFVNTLGLPFDQPLDMPLNGVILSVSRWEAAYDIQKHLAFAGWVNEGNFSWPGGYVTEGQAKCLGIFQGERSSISTVVRVEYRFDLRGDGHQKNVINQSAIGYANDGGTLKTGLFVGGSDGEPMGSIRIDADGLPIATGVKVMPPRPYTGSGFGAHTPPEESPSAALVNPALTTATQTVLTFARHKMKSFADIDL